MQKEKIQALGIFLGMDTDGYCSHFLRCALMILLNQTGAGYITSGETYIALCKISDFPDTTYDVAMLQNIKF
jgi:hypothetical protein